MVVVIIGVILAGFIYIAIDVNKYNTNLYYGKKGSGKSTLFAYLILIDLKRGKHVYSNCGFIVPDNKKFKGDYNELKDDQIRNGNYLMSLPAESVIYLDELGLIANNRDYKSFPKSMIEYIKNSRKLHHKFVACSQSTDVDKAIRLCIDNYYIVRRFGKLTYYHKVFVTLKPCNSDLMKEPAVENYSCNFLPDKILFRPFYYKYFDTSKIYKILS